MKPRKIHSFMEIRFIESPGHIPPVLSKYFIMTMTDERLRFLAPEPTTLPILQNLSK